MAKYQHGIISTEKATVMEKPIEVESAIAVVFGTAPINMAKDPYSVTNVPIVLEGYEDAVNKLGFSYNFKDYTICQSVFTRFVKSLRGPIVVVNVLDPKVHVKDVIAKTFSVINKKVEISDQGILLDTMEVKSADGTTTYEANEDYITSFADDGTVIIAITNDGKITATEVKVEYKQLAPEMVTKEDVIGGYNEETRRRTGIDCISLVYPMTKLIPCQLLAPGWSQNPVVAAVLSAKAKLINSLFNAVAITDIDSVAVTKIDDLLEYKEKNGYEDNSNIACYPKVIVDGYEIYLSAILDCAIANTDQAYDGPYASPSNKEIDIDGTCLEGGESIFYDLDEANEINAVGIVTAINMNGWRTWGNEMSCYPNNQDIKDRFIVSRRVFNYRDNEFKTQFFEKVDDPTNFRLIESIVNKENAILATLASAGKIAGGSISYNRDDNPTEQILDGHIIFARKLSPFGPAKCIETVTEFDPTLNISALGGE